MLPTALPARRPISELWSLAKLRRITVHDRSIPWAGNLALQPPFQAARSVIAIHNAGSKPAAARIGCPTKLFTGHVARVVGCVQLDQYSVRVSELEAFV